MPKLFDIVQPGRPADVIGDQKDVGLLKLDSPPVSESVIAAFGFQKSRSALVCQLQDFHGGLLNPFERSSEHALIAPIDSNRVVSFAAAKPIAPLWLASICVGSRVDQNLVAARSQHDAQSIGVAMSRATPSEWPGIDDCLGLTVHHDDNTGIRKDAGFPLHNRSLTVTAQNFRTQPPDGLRCQILGVISPILAVEEYAGSRDARAWEMFARPVRMEQSAAIVVPEKRLQARRSGHCLQIVRHAFQLRKVFGVGPSQDRVQQEHIEHVYLIVSGLLEGAAIAANLPGKLLTHHPATLLHPAFCSRKSGEIHTERVQRQGFANQVVVRREIDGEVISQMTTMQV